MAYKDSKYPQEHLIELNGLSPFLTGRILITESNSGYDAEIDIIQTESGKIYNHVSIIYGESDPRELFNLGMHQLKQFLLRKIH